MTKQRDANAMMARTFAKEAVFLGGNQELGVSERPFLPSILSLFSR
jgi:hypothetical protein